MSFIKTNQAHSCGIILSVICVKILDSLNKEQREAVVSTAQHIRIIAGAGSGKTRVLISRILYLIQEMNVSPYRICAITFTNKAANEMKERLEQGSQDGIGVNTSTIHALCVRILRQEHEAIGLTRFFTILDTADQESILREIYKQKGIERQKLSFKTALNYISDVKFQTQAGQILELQLDEWTLGQLKTIYRLYTKRSRELNALDFDDLLIETYKLFQSREDIKQRWQARYDVILVDEFQDVDHIQYGIIQSLAGTDNQLYVVGDPDQTIYTWRGADVRNITQFESVYPDAQTITLNMNYRSSQLILDAANRLIQNNKERTAKDLVAASSVDYPIHYEEFSSGEDEAYWIAMKIKHLEDSNESLDEIAVLYRSSYLTRSLERLLIQRGIPYLVYGGIRFYDRKEIKDTVAFLRMISHGDDLALRRSIGASPRGIGNKTLEDVWEQAQSSGLTMYEVMFNAVANHTAGKRIVEYVQLIERLKELSETEAIATLIDIILDKGGLSAHYEKKGEEDRIDTVKELQVDAMRFEETSGGETLNEFIQMVSLYGEKAEVSQSEHVKLMTIHAAKGLEFNNVFVMGVAENVFPSQRALAQRFQEAMEEERRLMYVAITRARHRLFVTNNNEYSYVAGIPLRASRFIRESGLDRVHEPFQMKPTQDRRVYTLNDLEEEDEEDYIQVFKKADLIHHSYFGDGIVIDVSKDTYQIAFNFPHGIKTIQKNFDGLKKMNKGD